MAWEAAALLAGLALLVAGGESIVRGAAGLSTALGVPRLLVGLTLVAMGTSAPELTVNIVAALHGSTGLSFGNIIGSNLANVGLVIGLAGLVRPLFIQNVLVSREIPIMLIITFVTVALASDFVRGATRNALDRADGIVLLILFGLYGYLIALDWARQQETGSVRETGAEGSSDLFDAAPLRCLGLCMLGLALLVAGGQLAVRSATEIAMILEVPEAWIGLTIVAVGTSLPELVTAIVAAMRNEVDLAVGNVVGSNIFNLALVAGSTATLAPVRVPTGGFADLVATSVLSLLLLVVSRTRTRTIIRAEAGSLLVIYVAYIIWRSTTIGV